MKIWNCSKNEWELRDCANCKRSKDKDSKQPTCSDCRDEDNWEEIEDEGVADK